jgi:hypothetical protein
VFAGLLVYGVVYDEGARGALGREEALPRRVSLFDSSRWMLQGEAVRKRLRVLWSLESMKHRFMASMFFLPSEATRPRMYVEKFLNWGLVKHGLNCFRSSSMTLAVDGTSIPA